ncbi:MAG: translation initiation factor IF-6 [Thermoplasmata archaeon]|nr:translation initiation factor IF-6 [Thermoplasmata archaeon]
MPVSRTLFSGSPYLGVYLRIGDKAALIPPSTPASLQRDLERWFSVPTVRSTVHDSEVVGAFVAMNSRGAVVGDEVDDVERAHLETLAPLTVVRARHNAMGNNVLANDQGALVHPEFSDEAVDRIGRALHVPAQRGTVAGLGTVGMAGIATNRGVVVHPKATEREVAAIEAALKVPVHRSTANFGVPIVGACIVANSRGLLVGLPTTPVEISHLQEGLQIFD